MKGELFTLGGWIDKAAPTKDSFKVTLAIPHSHLDTLQIGRLIQLATASKECFLMLKTADFNPDEIEIMELTQVDSDDSHMRPSDRLYRKLFVLYKKREEKGTMGHGNFNAFYADKMEEILNLVQKSINKEDI